jgi:hypothetical protein
VHNPKNAPVSAASVVVICASDSGYSIFNDLELELKLERHKRLDPRRVREQKAKGGALHWLAWLARHRKLRRFSSRVTTAVKERKDPQRPTIAFYCHYCSFLSDKRYHCIVNLYPLGLLQ